MTSKRCRALRYERDVATGHAIRLAKLADELAEALRVISDTEFVAATYAERRAGFAVADRVLARFDEERFRP